MERLWLYDALAISVTRIDFLDPAVASEPDARERGVRIEVRPSDSAAAGSIYASPMTRVHPAICRVDLLESAPGAADRMHWHPHMADGEPGERTFDRAMPPDPVGWLSRFLAEGLPGLLADRGFDIAGLGHDLADIAASADDIAASVAAGLAWAREPWPAADHDERGMAVRS